MFGSRHKAGRWRWRGGYTIFVCYTFIGLLNVPQIYLYHARAPKNFPLWPSLGRNFLGLYAWALMTPLIFWLGRRFPIERQHITRNLALHFLLSIPFAFTQTALDIALTWITGRARAETFGALLGSIPLAFFLNMLTNGILYYASILAVGQAVNYFRKYKERELDLMQAQLHSLKTQLHPHFLFNTLNAITELVYESPERADRTITRLSHMLRLSLKTGKAQEVALHEELDFLRSYIEIQRTLMQDRLHVIFEVDDAALDASVPNMLLQPLVENSIKHGLAPRSTGGRVEVVARRRGDWLYLRVSDDGLGLGRRPGNSLPASSYGSGVGLVNTRERLRHLYDGTHRFELRENEGGGLTIAITIPFRETDPTKDDEDTRSDR